MRVIMLGVTADKANRIRIFVSQKTLLLRIYSATLDSSTSFGWGSLPGHRRGEIAYEDCAWHG
jgi:hypothetical protein